MGSYLSVVNVGLTGHALSPSSLKCLGYLSANWLMGKHTCACVCVGSGCLGVPLVHYNWA